MRKTREDIGVIVFPNNAQSGDDTNIYRRKAGYEFSEIFKQGDAAPVKWFMVYKGDNLVAEIKESVCNIYFVIKREIK